MKGTLLRLRLERCPPNLVSYSISPGNGIPAQDKEQQGSKLYGVKVSSKKRGCYEPPPKCRNRMLNLLCSSFDWCPACWISFGTIFSSCESPGSFRTGQVALSWENASVMESFFHGNNCTPVGSAAEVAAVWGGAGHPLLYLWGGLDSAAGAGWGSSAFHFYMKTYWVVIALRFPLSFAFIKIGLMKWLPQYILWVLAP